MKIDQVLNEFNEEIDKKITQDSEETSTKASEYQDNVDDWVPVNS